MSEYQYYEFRALDRPLTSEQMREIGRCSSRAEITATSVSVEYHWGDFKGNPDQWMERYFDAFVHVANWGSRWFMLRVPSDQIGSEIVSEYCADDCLSFNLEGKNLILSFRWNDEGGEWTNGEEWLSSLVALRADLISGDHRCLYLAWLRSIQGMVYEGDAEYNGATEPPVPAGLRTLNSQLECFADFFGLDSDLIAAAAEQSEDEEQLRLSRSDTTAWVRDLSPEDKDSLLVGILEDDGSHPEAALRQRFRRDMQSRHSAPRSDRLRTSAQIVARADQIMKDRQRIKAEKAEHERLRRQREQAEKQREHLASMRGRETEFWIKVDQLIVTKKPKRYDEAVAILQDLRDLAEKDGATDAFCHRLQSVRIDHANKPSLLQRLHEAGLSAQLLPIDPNVGRGMFPRVEQFDSPDPRIKTARHG